LTLNIIPTYFEMLGVGSAFGLSGLLIATWGMAYHQGGAVLVTINEYGEMYPELAMFTLLIPVMLYGAWETMGRWWDAWVV